MAITALALCCGCAPNVDITKTAKGFYQPTDPNDVEILMTRPDRPYTELGVISSNGWMPSDTAKMHNALRAKAAPLGANAVLITQSGIIPGYVPTMWTNGVAIRWR